MPGDADAENIGLGREHRGHGHVARERQRAIRQVPRAGAAPTDEAFARRRCRGERHGLPAVPVGGACRHAVDARHVAFHATGPVQRQRQMRGGLVEVPQPARRPHVEPDAGRPVVVVAPHVEHEIGQRSAVAGRIHQVAGGVADVKVVGRGTVVRRRGEDGAQRMRHLVCGDNRGRLGGICCPSDGLHSFILSLFVFLFAVRRFPPSSPKTFR